MYEDLNRRYRQWRTADEEGRDQDADAAFGAVFETVPEQPVPPAFTAATMARIAEAATREAWMARRVRKAMAAGSLAGAVATAYFGSAYLWAAFSGMVVRLFDVLVGLTVRTADGLQTGAGIWGVLASLGRAAGAFVAEPAVTIALIALQGIAIAALVTLQRLLGSEEDSFK